MPDDFEAGLRARLRAEMSQMPFAVTRQMVEDRMARRSSKPVMALAVAGLAMLAVVIIAVLAVAPRMAPNVGAPSVDADELRSDPCALLAVDDVEGATDSTVTTTRLVGADVMNDPFPVQRCVFYTDGRYGRITVAVDPDGRDDFGEWRDANRGPTLTALVGLADEAYSSGDAAVRVRAGSGYFEISPERSTDSATMGDMAELARMAVTKIGTTAAEPTWAPAAIGPDNDGRGGSCPVTTPNPAFVAPAPYPAFPPDDRQAWIGTSQLWTMLDLEGQVEDAENAAFPIGLKTFWWSSNWAGMRQEPQPNLTVIATRLDGDESVSAEQATNAATGSLGGEAMLAGIELPSPGCWRLAAEYRGAALSYVLFVEGKQGDD